MEGKDKLFFRISSSLKDIIGKDLITDDYIAVFELVKNSFDAYASKVDIYFENIYSDNPSIKIIDNGKGMDYNDIISKWLFVAYSAKVDGSEDSNYDYRNRISIKRNFAGAKGIGRFSCDRLGRYLLLITRKDKKNSSTEKLLTDWELFEKDSKKEFINISVIHESIPYDKSNAPTGTTLEINELRSSWNREKLLKLKDSLSKLISPISNPNTKPSFKINLHCDEELKNDQQYNNDIEKVNGEIKNFIFETLGLKTTKIHAKISDDGEFLQTELTDGGTRIYKIKESNSYKLLKGIDYTLYYLNRSAKLTFATKMGVNSVNFGHIFIYKNGFRIYPYGEPGEDSLGVDKRKGQGYNRFIGTRELLGQIQINSNKVGLKETTSRGDGLIENDAYNELIDCFWATLRRLEKYVVEVQQWGLSIEILEGSYGVKERIADLLAKLSGSNTILEFDVPDNIIEIIESSQIHSAEALSKNLSRLAFESGSENLISEAKRISGKLVELQSARKEAEEQALKEFDRAAEVTRKLKEQISENLFLKSINTGEYKEVISLLHHIGIFAGTIDNNLKNISLRIQNDIPLSNDELYDIIRHISFETKKILNVVSFATKANFKLSTEKINANLIGYMKEYIQNIIPTIMDDDLTINIEDFTDMPFRIEFKPIEINIIIDNLISNAKKANSSNLLITFSSQSDNLIVTFKDNGVGIPGENIDRVYDFGFTTTNGSGIGLYHIKEIIGSLKGKINVSNNKDIGGVTFTLNFKKT